MLKLKSEDFQRKGTMGQKSNLRILLVCAALRKSMREACAPAGQVWHEVGHRRKIYEINGIRRNTNTPKFLIQAIFNTRTFFKT